MSARIQVNLQIWFINFKLSRYRQAPNKSLNIKLMPLYPQLKLFNRIFNPLNTEITGKECCLQEDLAQYNKDAATKLPHTSRLSHKAN